MKLNVKQKLDVKIGSVITILFLLFFVYNSTIREYFKLRSPDYEVLLGDRYFLWQILNLFGLFIFALIPFIIGVRYQIGKTRKMIEEEIL